MSDEEKLSKKEQLNIVETKYKYGKTANNMIAQLKKKKQEFFSRKSDYIEIVIHEGTEYVFPIRGEERFPPQQLWLFGAVQRDAIKFILNNEKWEMPVTNPTNLYNLKYDDTIGIITGTDINSAYWEIAHQIGVISDVTYTKATFDEYKKVRLASLAILGRKIAFKHYVDGVEVAPFILDHQTDSLRNIYRAIRYICYRHMQEIGKLLGDDFECYRTDCIYYRDTPENRALVYNYLDKEGFDYKQLVYEAPTDLESIE